MITRRSATEFTVLGLLIGLLAFANFIFFMEREGIMLTVDDTNMLSYFQITALAYATIVFCQYVNILQWRQEYRSLFNRRFFSNKILHASIAVSIGLVLLAIYAPGLSDFLSFDGLAVLDWAFVGIAALIYLAAFEVLKMLRRWQDKKTTERSE